MSGRSRQRDWVTIRDVAHHAGVSPMTVSRTFKTPALVTEAKRDQVLASAIELGYVPNLAAGHLSSGRSGIVGAIVPSVRNSNFSTMIEGLGGTLSSAGLHLMLAVASTPDDELEVVRALLGRRPDGLVLTGTQHRRETKRILKASGVTVVETWELAGPFIDSGVGFATYEAAREMTQHLIDRGRVRIGYADFATLGRKRFLERRRGYVDAMQAAGLSADLIATVPDDSGFLGGRLALRQLSAAEPGLDALFCVTDPVAVGVIFECARLGWPVPSRLAVAGLGDYQVAREVSPALTTIRTRGYEIGSAAGKILSTRLRGESIGSSVVDVGYEFVMRESA